MMWDGTQPYPWYDTERGMFQTNSWGAEPLLPWWFRSPTYVDRGLFTEAYPVLGPYYSFWTVNPEWIDAWSMQPYQGMW